MNNTEEEEIIRRRLLIDGDGTGDERRINILLKKFFKWCNSEDSPTDGKDLIQSQITQCEYAFVKSRLAAAMSLAELENYSSLNEQISDTMANVQNEIQEAKKEFQEAKLIRKNRLEYEALARVINEQPDRKQTNEKLSNIKNELHSLEEKLECLEAKLDIRRKQFHVFFTSLYQLQSTIEADEPFGNETFVTIDEDEEDVSALINKCLSTSSDEHMETEVET